jgi:ATP-dependent Clp protease adaptor protein ClpS
MTQQRGSSQTDLLEKEDVKVSRPSMYKVILLNDDYTPMDFVVHILKKYFKKDETSAAQIMLQVHNQGAGIAGIYQRSIAETKAHQVIREAQKSEYPLKCIVEKDSSEESTC